MSVSRADWPPATEAEATSNLAGLVEWLRATGRRLDATPAGCRAWPDADRQGWRAAVAGFTGIADTDERLDDIGHALFVVERRPDDVTPAAPHAGAGMPATGAAATPE